MQASRKPLPLLTQRSRPSASTAHDAPSPEQSDTASSGTYRAVRPTAALVAALAQGGSVIDRAKVEGLRFELDVGVWRGDSERIAGCVVDDAECTTADGNDDE
jgi:hypothetical protein